RVLSLKRLVLWRFLRLLDFSPWMDNSDPKRTKGIMRIIRLKVDQEDHSPLFIGRSPYRANTAGALPGITESVVSHRNSSQCPLSHRGYKERPNLRSAGRQCAA